MRPAKNATKKKAKTTQAEVTAIGKILRSIGSIGGGALGSMVGASSAGSEIGHGLGGAISRWFGQGDYTVSSNSIVQRASAGGTIPNMHKDGQSIIVRHKEYLTEIRGSTTFVVRNEFDINPGLSSTFPWLSGIASQYSQYRIRGMVYHYVPSSGNAVSSTSAALGTVMLQTSYRATEDAPSNKIELLNEYWSSEAKPDVEFCHPIECDPKENPFNVQYVRTGDLPSTENQLMYDLGRTSVAVSGQQASDNVLGDLWVTYEIELKKPVITNANNADIQTYSGISSTLVGSGNPFGSAGSFTKTFSSFDGTITVAPTTVTFSKGIVGVYQVTAFYQGSSAFTGAAYTVSNGVLISMINGSSTIASNFTAGSGTAVNTTWVKITDPGLSCVLTANLTTVAGAAAVRLLITEINPSAST
jgi:hypothetical protein